MIKTAMRGFILSLAFLPVMAVSPSPVQAADIIIGTGSTAGVYFQVGRAICRMANRYAQGLSCEALASPGSLSNLSNVQGGALEIGLAQSDWQFHAVKGSGQFKFMDSSYKNIRALFSVHGEPFTVVVRRDAGIKTFDDLKGKRVNIGNPGSGQRGTMEVVMKAKGWTKKDFRLAEELPASQQSLALCHNRVQAMVYTVGHPNASVSKAAGLCDAAIIDVGGAAIDKLVADHPYYTYVTIPGGMYSNNDNPVKTFGVKATVVSSSDVSADDVYKLVKAIFGNLDKFKKMHPAFGDLVPKVMIKDGLTAPLHEGAVRYYKEQGLM